ncbi:MAG: ABC transporter ATP-binding protein [Granulosicoccus sp.]
MRNEIESEHRLSARSLTINKARNRIIDNVSLHVDAGELVGLIGPNGAGKSTLLAALAGIEKPAAGTITIDQKNLRTIPAGKRAEHIAWLEQLGSVHWPVTVERLVMLGRIPHLAAWSRATSTDQQAVEKAMLDAGCELLSNRQVTTLSGGERARVLLARALATEPDLLFADEPVSALDLGHQLQTMQVLRDFSRDHRAALVVLHDLSLAARYCDRLYLINHGKVVADGQVAAVLTPQNLADVYGVRVISGCEEVPWIVPVERL